MQIIYVLKVNVPVNLYLKALANSANQLWSMKQRWLPATRAKYVLEINYLLGRLSSHFIIKVIGAI